MICFPLKSINSSLIYGTISIYTKFEFIFSKDDIKFLRDFANQISNIIQILEEKKELELINKISTKINLENEVEDIFKIAVNELPLITGFNGCSILKMISKNIFKIVASTQTKLEGKEVAIKNKALKEIVKILKEIVEEPRIEFFPDVQNDNRLLDTQNLIINVKSMVWIPIFVEKDKFYGIIVLVTSTVKGKQDIKKLSNNSFNEYNRSIFNTLSNLIGTAIEKNELIYTTRLVLTIHLLAA